MTTFIAPNLLNDDGNASIATALMMSHHGLRRDIARFATALPKLARRELSASALCDEWRSYRNTLHGHHESEDTRMFPGLASQNVEIADVIAQLSADHRRIDPLLERGDRAFASLESGASEALDVVLELSSLLTPHLAIEDTHLIPFLRAARAFPPPSTETEAEMYAQGFAWSSHGVAAAVLERVDAMLPAILTAKLPAARAAFEARCVRVWGSAQTGWSRTSVPVL